MKESFASLEGLRAWMAWWVVFGHVLQISGSPSWMPQRFAQLMLRGDAAVHVFVILSGFVISHLILNKAESYSTYIRRRFFRLFPLYLTCLVFAWLVIDQYRFAYLELPFSTQIEMRADRLAETEAHSVLHWLAHLSMLHGAIPSTWLPYAGTSILAPFWSLSLEWQFYLVAPALITCMARSGASCVLGAFILLGVSMLSRRYMDQYYQYSSMLLLSLQFFAVGIMSRLAMDRVKVFGATPLLALAAIFAVIALRYPLEISIWAVWMAFVLSERFKGDAGVSLKMVCLLRFLFATNKIIIFLGRSSYSTYLVHIPFLVMVVYFLAKGVPSLDLRGEIFRDLCIGMLLLVPLAWLMYICIERPAIRWARKS